MACARFGKTCRGMCCADDSVALFQEHDASCRVVCCGRDVFGKAYRPPVLVAKLVMYFGVVLAVIAGIVTISVLATEGARTDLIVWVVAFMFAAVATITSLYDVSRHLLFYREPELQLHYVRILWMVAIYAIESWLSLRFRSYAIYWETARECYEAFVLWSFYRLLMSFLAAEHGVGWTVTRTGGEPTVLAERWQAVRMGLSSDTVMGAILRHSCDEAMSRRERMGPGEAEKAGDVVLSVSGRGGTPRVLPSPGKAGEVGDDDLAVRHAFPLCCVPAWGMGVPFLRWTRWAVFQYVVVRVACTVLTVILTPLGLYGEGEFSNPAKLYLWSVLAINASQCWALYCLLLVYLQFHTALAGLQPGRKFVVIKAIVFLCWWQSLVVSGMAAAGWLEGTATWSPDQVERGLQDFLICVEMALIALVHHRVYSYTDFVPSDGAGARLLEHGAALRLGPGAAAAQPPGADRRPFMDALRHMGPADVVGDVPRILGPRQVSDAGMMVSPPTTPGSPGAAGGDEDEESAGTPASRGGGGGFKSP